MKSREIRKLLCLTFIAGSIVMTGCAGNASNSAPAANTGAQQTAEQTQEDQTAAQEAAEDMVIETKYGNLHYNDQWREFVKIEQSEDGDVVSVAFTAVINDNEYPLFVVNIGGGEGSEVGKLTDADGKERIVYIKASEIKEEEALDANEQNRLYAMQEDINYVVDHLK